MHTDFGGVEYWEVGLAAWMPLALADMPPPPPGSAQHGVCSPAEGGGERLHEE